jgi:hypothetical protein
MKLYSTCLRIACLIDNQGLESYMDSVHLIRAENKNEAFEKALKLGYSHEQEYLNGENHKVRWVFKQVISLDSLGNLELDGLEVYSQPVDLVKNAIEPFDIQYKPAESEYTASVVHDVEED